MTQIAWNRHNHKVLCFRTYMRPRLSAATLLKLPVVLKGPDLPERQWEALRPTAFKGKDYGC